MFFFDQKVTNLKAWELYLGNALWTFFIGIILVLVIKLLDIFGLEKTPLGDIIHRTGEVIGARQNVANEVLDPSADAQNNPASYS